jgi:hypothetical protein
MPLLCRNSSRYGFPGSHFTSLEQSWLRLAAEVESGQRLLDLVG